MNEKNINLSFEHMFSEMKEKYDYPIKGAKMTIQQNKALKVRNSVKVPLAKDRSANFVTFYGVEDQKDHVVLDFRKEKQNQEIIDVRIHSECLTGDIFGSSRCDCGEQLQEAIKKFDEVGGVLIYLRQEGRGIGLYNKLDAYALQLKGLDTYEANRHLGLGDDLRDYKIAAEMLKAMNIKKIRLLSNNPLKSSQLQEEGIEIVEKVSTGVFLKKENTHYLEAKVNHTKHSIDLAKYFAEAL